MFILKVNVSWEQHIYGKDVKLFYRHNISIQNMYRNLWKDYALVNDTNDT